ncbi:MAG: hypothetical protein E6J42_12335 [Chloroflexi bacterium]|nr:MAG: hypothetical protein E6J42_12335 [Chloroflexota bacterium]
MSSKTALPVALLVVVFLMAWPTAKLLAQNTCPGCSEPAKVVHPNGFGPHSYARWQPKTGLGDSGGSNAFSMLLVHLTPATITATAKAVVAIEGFDGEPVGLGGVTSLELFVREKDAFGNPTGECTLTGGPRFSIRYRISSPPDLFLEAHCQAMTAGAMMTAQNFPLSTYRQRTFTVPPISGAIIVSLAILYDDPVVPSSHIDNISVTDVNLGCTPCTWTRPADNGSN